MSISIKNIIEDIDTFRNKEVPGFTFEEWKNELNIGDRKLRLIFRQLVKHGKIIVHQEKIKDITGRYNYTFKYELIDESNDLSKS